MINLNKIEGTDIFEFSIDGKINKKSVEDFYALLEVKSEQHQNIKLLGTITEFPGFEDFKAFSSTLKMKAKAIRSVNKFALLSNRDWIESIMPVGNFVTPGIPMKHFDLDERNEAIAWLKKEEDNTVSEDEYLSQMDIERIKGTDIYRFTIDGKIDEAGMTALYNILNDKTRQGKVHLLACIKDFGLFDSFKSFVKGLKVDLATFGNIDRFAIVSDKSWISTLAEIESKIIPEITMKGFSKGEEDKAIAWLREN